LERIETMETFEGNLVRLDPIDSDSESELINSWFEDGEFFRLLDERLTKIPTVDTTKEFIERINKEGFIFGIRTRKELSLIGFVALGNINSSTREAWVGIAIGDRGYQGRGYGADAMNIIVRFAFLELNLNRISLDVFEYNNRGIRSYEKVGFKLEGRERESIYRDGKWWDTLYMGILRKDWEEKRTAVNR
jgi:RimJ/RimL family protein N-acetyltransferase